MNRHSVSWFSIGALFDIFRRRRWRGRTLVATRPDRDRVADYRALHTILADVAVLERRGGAAFGFEPHPNLFLLPGCKSKPHLEVRVSAMVEGNRHGARPHRIPRENPGARERCDGIGERGLIS